MGFTWRPHLTPDEQAFAAMKVYPLLITQFLSIPPTNTAIESHREGRCLLELGRILRHPRPHPGPPTPAPLLQKISGGRFQSHPKHQGQRRYRNQVTPRISRRRPQVHRQHLAHPRWRQENRHLRVRTGRPQNSHRGDCRCTSGVRKGRENRGYRAQRDWRRDNS